MRPGRPRWRPHQICTDNGSPLAVTGSASPYSASVTGEGIHDIDCTVSDNAGNDNDDSDEVKIDTLDPTTSSANATPTPTNHGPTITASVSDVGTGNNSITRAEFSIDAVGVDGAGTAMASSDGIFNSATEAVPQR